MIPVRTSTTRMSVLSGMCGRASCQVRSSTRPPPPPFTLSKSERINPSCPAALTLDQPFALADITSTEVPGPRRASLAESVEGPALRFTVPFVLSVVEVATGPSVSRSDLMKPSDPLCLTLDQPFDWASINSTLVPIARTLMTFAFVDADALRFTPPVVLSVVPLPLPEVCAASVRKLLLTKPTVPLCLILDQPFD